MHCAIVSNTDHRRWLQIIHQNHTYQVRGWKPLRPIGGDGGRGAVGANDDVAVNSLVDHDGVDGGAHLVKANGEVPIGEDVIDGSMQAWNLPTRGRDGTSGHAYLSYRNRRFQPYQKGDAGWFSKIFDQSIEDFSSKMLQS